MELSDWTLELVDLGGEWEVWRGDGPLPVFLNPNAPGTWNLTWDPGLVELNIPAPWTEFTQNAFVDYLAAGPQGEGLYLFGLNTIPEPSTFILCAFGLLGLAVGWRRKR